MREFKLFHNLARTHNLGELGVKDVGKDVILMGWAARTRDLGGFLFLDLRDRFGTTQVVFDPQDDDGLYRQAASLKHEYVVAVKGKVRARPDGMRNAEMATGAVEVVAASLEVLNPSDELPFQIEDKAANTSETLKLKYRYLDLRRQDIKNNILTRAQVVRNFRQALEAEGFLDIETPFLYKSTPEGAREFLVPSRIHPGQFYALPQSPQLFKQILMVSGFDRYYQVVKCFRDEDLRADRQPEFTQVDCELSFADQETVLQTFERVTKKALGALAGIDPGKPFPRMKFADAMEKYGCDKPDTRFDMQLVDVSDLARGSAFQVFTGAVAAKGIVNALCLKGKAEQYSRKAVDELDALVKKLGAKGLAWVKITGDAAEPWQGPISKFFSKEDAAAYNARTGAAPGDMLFFVAGPYEQTKASLSALRLHLGHKHGLMDAGKFNFLWVIDFPLMERDPGSGRLMARHHPFTSPLPEDIGLLEKDPDAVRASAYDLVLNGNEVAGGSIRIHDVNLQRKVFDSLGITEKEAEEKFGFLLEALRYGAPPHGGIAFGLDRLVMCVTRCEAIRDIIAFPKTQKATCLMTSSPAAVTDRQLAEVHIRKSEAAEGQAGMEGVKA